MKVFFLQKELWNVSDADSSLKPPVKDELLEEITIEEHEVRLDR
jgi:hypothetical protein